MQGIVYIMKTQLQSDLHAVVLDFGYKGAKESGVIGFNDLRNLAEGIISCIFGYHQNNTFFVKKWGAFSPLRMGMIFVL